MRSAKTILVLFAGVSISWADYFTQRQETAKQALPYAELSSKSYGKTIGENVIAGWDALDYYTSPSGLQAFAYQNQATGKTVIVFRGSDEGKDWPDNAIQASGLLSKQYREGLAYAKAMKKDYGDIVVTGHSLGGGIAQYSAGQLGLEAWTFNPAGLGSEAQLRLGLSLLNEGKCKKCGRITNVVVNGEILDKGRMFNFGLTTLAGKTVKFDLKKEDAIKGHDLATLKKNLQKIAKGSKDPYTDKRKDKEAVASAHRNSSKPSATSIASVGAEVAAGCYKRNGRKVCLTTPARE